MCGLYVVSFSIFDVNYCIVRMKIPLDTLASFIEIVALTPFAAQVVNNLIHVRKAINERHRHTDLSIFIANFLRSRTDWRLGISSHTSVKARSSENTIFFYKFHALAIIAVK